MKTTHKTLALFALTLMLAGCTTSDGKPKQYLFQEAVQPEEKPKPKPQKAKTSKQKFSKPVRASGSVQKLVLQYASKHGVPACLALAVSQQESAHRCHVRGAAGEVGPLQIKPASARMLGYRGSTQALLNSCSLQVEWGMKHLYLAYSKGGQSSWRAAFRHNAGPYAKSYRNRHASSYANSVQRKMGAICG